MVLKFIKKTIKQLIIIPFRQFLKPKPKVYCKQEVSVIKYTDGSWLTIATTPDQQRIEDYLVKLAVSKKQILHIGTGNSSFAKQFYLNNKIDSVTIVDDEFQHALSLKLPNYNCFKINKYSNEILKLSTKYDVISDNNLSSFACCRKHFEGMMCNYFSLLKINGFIITDTKGMAYHQDFAFPISIEDIKKILPKAKIEIIDKTVLVIKIA